MNIKRAKEEIEHTVKAYLAKDALGEYAIPAIRQRPILLMGPPGIGKTQIMEQAARECGVALVAYTITHHTRQSAVGLPFIRHRNFGGADRSVTEYTMSEIIASVYDKMEQTGLEHGILFIDEINCVSETLAPTMLQFLQCKTFGNQAVPAGWVIVAAGNPPEYNKSVRDFDLVTLDRVRRIDIEPNLAVWQEYARAHRLHPAVQAYLELRPQHFYRIQNDVERASTTQDVTDRAVENGDIVNLDYAGSVDGVAFEGGTAQGQSLTIGSGMFIPGFEEQLIGAKIGEDVTVHVTFPKDYRAENLAGRDAEFRCKIHEIRQNVPYELDDTFAKEVGQCRTLDEMRGRLRESLRAYYEDCAEMELQDKLMRQVAATLDYKPTDAELEQGVDSQIEVLKAQLARKGLTLEAYCQFTGETEAQLREDAKPEAENSIRIQRAAERIALLEGLSASAEEIAEELAGICKQNGMTMEQLRPYLNADFEATVASNVRMKKAIAFVRDHAVITEKMVEAQKH